MILTFWEVTTSFNSLHFFLLLWPECFNREERRNLGWIKLGVSSPCVISVFMMDYWSGCSWISWKFIFLSFGREECGWGKWKDAVLRVGRLFWSYWVYNIETDSNWEVISSIFTIYSSFKLLRSRTCFIELALLKLYSSILQRATITRIHLRIYMW